MASDNLSFISYNVKGIQQSSKRIKVFEYLKYNFLPNGFVFCKRHTPPWRVKSNFKGEIIYSRGTENSCGVVIAFLGSEVVETKNDDEDRILILDITFCGKELLLVNLYNVNTEKEQYLSNQTVFLIL